MGAVAADMAYGNSAGTPGPGTNGLNNMITTETESNKKQAFDKSEVVKVSKKEYLKKLKENATSQQEVDEWIDQNLSGALAQADADESLMLQAAASAAPN